MQAEAGPAEVSAEDALSAALDRVSRTTRALVLAEAQIVGLRREVAEAVQRAEAAEKRADVAEAEGRDCGAEDSPGVD